MKNKTIAQLDTEIENKKKELENLIKEKEERLSNIDQNLPIGKIWQPQEKAQFEAQREKFTRLFRQYVEQHTEPHDWRNFKQSKYFRYYSYIDKCIKYCYYNNDEDTFTIYASSKDIFQDAINFIGEYNFNKYILKIEE